MGSGGEAAELVPPEPGLVEAAEEAEALEAKRTQLNGDFEKSLQREPGCVVGSDEEDGEEWDPYDLKGERLVIKRFEFDVDAEIERLAACLDAPREGGQGGSS